MRIVEVEEDCEVVGQAYEQRLTCEGILDNAESATYLELDRVERSPEEGWDELALRIFTRDPDNARWAKGSRYTDDAGATVPGFTNLFVTDRNPTRHRAKDYWMLELTLKGLKTSKEYKRRINGNVTSSTSRFAGYLSVSADRWQNFPPTDSGTDNILAGTDLEVEYDSATVQISDTYIYADDPPFDKIGQPWTPPDPPDVTVLTISGESIKYFFPFGWKCSAMPAEKLAGANVWLVTVNYVYQVASIPTTTAA